MRAQTWVLSVLSALVLLAPSAFMQPAQPRGGQEEFGPYEPVANWPQPLPDGPDGVSHAGWTWGSVGGVFAESPDRIWVAMRGELPLPPEAKPWTTYGLLNPSRGNATGNDDGLSATCEPANPRGWQRRYHHVIFVVDRNGKQVQHWGQHDALFEMRCGRGPHKIKRVRRQAGGEVRQGREVPARLGRGAEGPGEPREGNRYVAEVFNGRVVKFRPKQGADPSKVVGQELRYRTSN